MVVRVVFEPLEPLMLRGTGEFDPFARGVAVSARSVGWPSPSTIAGAIVSELLSGGTFTRALASNWDEFVEKYLRVLSVTGINWLRGPYIHGFEVYVPLVLEGKRFYVIDLYSLLNVFKEYESSTKSYGEFVRIIEELSRQSPVLMEIERVGIALRTRSEGVKGVREGFLYSEILTALRGGSIVVEAEFSGDIKHLNGRAVKLGGEGRIVRVRVDGEAQLSKELEEFREGYAVMLSPFPMPGPYNVSAKNGRLLVKYKGLDIEIVMGRVGVRGLGFAVAEGRRKPLLPAILEGSIVKVKNCDKVHEMGLYGCLSKLSCEEKLFARIGFGSIYPL